MIHLPSYSALIAAIVLSAGVFCGVSPVLAQTLHARVKTEVTLPARWASLAAPPAVERVSERRDRISLDGAWRFAPVVAGAAQPEAQWGWARVPGSWLRPEDVLARGAGPVWDTFGEGKTSPMAWYERDVSIPTHWKNRTLILDFERLSTDAEVFVNDKPAGTVNWPEGQIDITHLVTPGQAAVIRVRVIATIDQGEVVRLMGTTPGQNFTEKADLKTAGLIGSVTLASRPGGAHISNVFVRPSVRDKRIRLDVELSDVTSAGPVDVRAEMVNVRGEVEQTFTSRLDVAVAKRQTISPSWGWPDPQLWDFGQPNLYTLRLSVTSPTIDDSTAERFGFREFWIDGRDYYLNGLKFRARTALVGGLENGPDAAAVDKLIADGSNLGELWPNDPMTRSVGMFSRPSYAVADEKGFLLTGITPHMDWMANAVRSPEKLAVFKAAAERIMRRDRNHPSIVMWGTSGNMFGGVLDPALIGQRDASQAVRVQRSPHMKEPSRFAELGLMAIRDVDPTRPIFIHHGGNSGDVYTINNYLNFIPLQEREEWLSAYVKHGDMPVWYVEFGTPVAISLMRGRNGFQKAMQSEPFLSEYCATYLGEESYVLEPQDYRQLIAEKFAGGQHYNLWWGFEKRMTFSPAWLKLQKLFITNTWRSWRTMGMSGGMIPWDHAYAERDGTRSIAGEALTANNSATLAWIAGSPEAFTEKSHSFFAGSTVVKQIAILNDARSPQRFSVRWKVTLAARLIEEGEADGELAVGETRMLPVTFKLPAAMAAKSDGEITLDATIGERTHTDAFKFRCFPTASTKIDPVVVFDPLGITSRMLASLGIETRAWDGRATDRLLVIGREAFGSDATLPGDIQAFAKAGGRILLMAQQPELLTRERGVRVVPIQTRRVFPIDPAHPVVAGLDAFDLRDWAGKGTLREAYPDYANDAKYNGPTPTNYPYYGWRWGTQGTVTSAAVEKPHRSGWRPILECEFDLAYTPLMELDLGNGRVVWSQLDFEDQAATDPAAAQLARQVIEYAARAPVSPRRTTVYVGDDNGAKLLDAVGATYERATEMPADDCVLVLGREAALNDDALRAWVGRGGRLLVLPHSQNDAPLGVILERRALENGSLAASPWQEVRGISRSDTRWRTRSDAWLVAGGAEIAFDGQVGRMKVGSGVAIFCQFDPEQFDADRNTFFRITRWRQTRAVAQLLANLGARFETDAIVFQKAERPIDPPSVSLVGEWRAKFVDPRKPAENPEVALPDPGLSEIARAAMKPDFDDSKWPNVRLPASNESFGDAWTEKDGESVFRRRFDVPAEMAGNPLVLELGTLDDNDETYVNGTRVGGRTDADAANWSVKRAYELPASLLKPSGNVIAVRVWDRYGGGGFLGKPDDLCVHPVEQRERVPAGLYHPDYIDDFDMGDDPYRYYNW